MELPQHLFDYLSSITPLVNVELILKDPQSSVLLTWRDDGLYGPGWHLPGGIIRHKETIAERILQVASSECGLSDFKSCQLLQLNQVMNPNRDLRGHFISFVFGLETDSPFKLSPPELSNGSRKAFTYTPPNLIQQHQRYRQLIDEFLAGTIPNHISEGNILSDSHILSLQHLPIDQTRL